MPPDGTEQPDPTPFRDTARADLLEAEAEYRAAVGDLTEDARQLVGSAEREYYGAIDSLKGMAANAMDAAEKPVFAYIDKKHREAERLLTSLYQDMYAAGAEPHVYAAAVAEDIARDDIYQSAMDQIVKPILLKNQPADDIPDIVPHDKGVCPPGYQFDGYISACRRIIEPDLPGPLPDVTVPPVVVQPQPGCPPTTVVVNVPPCPTAPTSPPASPPPPPADCDEVLDDGTCAPPEEEPAPVCPAGMEWDAEAFECVPVEMIPPGVEPDKPKPEPIFRIDEPPELPLDVPRMKEWDGPERCATLGRFGVGSPVDNTAAVAQEMRDELRDAILADLEYRVRLREENPDADPAVFETMKPYEWAVRAKMREMVALRNARQADKGAGIAEAIAGIAAARWEESTTRTPAQYLSQGWWYDLQWADPQFLPPQDAIDAAYLRGVIARDLWECLTRANGNKVWAREHVVDASRTKPDLYSLIKLYRRGLLGQQDFLNGAKGLGVLRADELAQFVASTDFIPPYTDLVRFMVRDVEDPKAVEFGGLDEDFGTKFTGYTKDAAAAQGIDEKTMRRIWRAHWRLPSFTSGKEMHHRLRPGRVPEAVQFSTKDFAEMLKYDDMAPGYIDRMIATSYHTITRTDVLQFYVNGAIDDNEVEQRLLDLGYSPADAKSIRDAWKLEVANRRQTRARLWTRLNILKAYIAGELGRDQADTLLSRSIGSAKERQDLLDDGDLRRIVERRRKCIKAVKTRRLHGEINEIESRRELVALGMDAIQAADIAEGWTCELASKQREPTVAMILDWMLRGYIDNNEAFRRLRNLRYSPDDAARILQKSIDDDIERRRKLIAAEQERIARAAEQAARQAASRTRQQRADQRAEARESRAAAGG